MRVPSEEVDKVRKILKQNNFPTKEPELSETARVLGLQRFGKNKWKRSKEIQPFSGKSYTDLWSWIATLASSHYPVLDWLRPAARAIERHAALDKPKAKGTDGFSEAIKLKCSQLYEDILLRGDPTHGNFMVDPNQQWKLYTDASKFVLGAAIYFGNTRVGDVSWLRHLGDIRPIDLLELEAVLKGLNRLVCTWHRALEIKDRLSLIVHVDNQPVLGQLNRRKANHWLSSKGLTSAIVESRLQFVPLLVT
jgi:hypothetical protein